MRNKAKVEGSICNAYLVSEASSFCSYYFEPHVYTRQRKVPRHDDGGPVAGTDNEGNLSIFIHPGRPMGRCRSRFMTEEEYEAAQKYILLNCQEIHPFIK